MGTAQDGGGEGECGGVGVTFTVLEAPQRSPAWHAARIGQLTGTCAAAMLATIKTGEAAARRDLRLRLVTERLTGQCQEDTYVNADMQRGTDLEPEAFAAYEGVTGSLVQRVGFLQHVSLPIGCSPDGVIGEWDGLLELKCPRSANHLRYLRAGNVPTEYLPQLRHALFVSSLPFIDFASYDPRFPDALQLFVIRLRREDAELPAYEKALVAFLAHVETELEAVRTLNDVSAQLVRAAEVA